MEVGLPEVLTVGLALVGLLLGAIKWLLAREFSSRDKYIDERTREWRLEMSSVKGAMEVKERDARDGRTALHQRIDILDEKLQRDYARQETISDIRTRLSTIDEKLSELLARK